MKELKVNSSIGDITYLGNDTNGNNIMLIHETYRVTNTSTKRKVFTKNGMIGNLITLDLLKQVIANFKGSFLSRFGNGMHFQGIISNDSRCMSYAEKSYFSDELQLYNVRGNKLGCALYVAVVNPSNTTCIANIKDNIVTLNHERQVTIDGKVYLKPIEPIDLDKHESQLADILRLEAQVAYEVERNNYYQAKVKELQAEVLELKQASERKDRVKGYLFNKYKEQKAMVRKLTDVTISPFDTSINFNSNLASSPFNRCLYR